MKETFIEKSFRPASERLIYKIIDICQSYDEQGLKLSVRQVYYQLVAHHGLPNREQSYKNIVNLVTDARLAGLIDWNLIEDRNRETIANPHWDTPADIVDACAKQFRIKLWDSQPCHVEVMVEKAALEGVLEPICRQWDVPFSSNRGYSSSSAMYENGQRLKDALDNGKRVVVLYLGDRDPSGIDMGRDVWERLALFCGAGAYETRCMNEDYDDEVYCPILEDGHNRDIAQVLLHWEFVDRFEVRRIALNEDQIRQYEPPPNPAKLSDSRSTQYVRRFGHVSYELDALEPRVLADLVSGEIQKELDDTLWKKAVAKQNKHRRQLAKIAKDLMPVKRGRK